MHLFKSSKYSPTKAAATTTVGGGGGNDGEGGLSSSGNGGEPVASTSARMKHKSMDMSFFPFSNFLTRSISRKVASSPERVPSRNNEFDMPGFLSRSWSINKKLDRSLSRSKSVAKGGNGNVWEVDTVTKPSHRRSQSTTRKNDWFGYFVDGRRDDGSLRGKSSREGSGSSRSKSTAARRSYASDGGSGSSRSGRPETDDEEGSSSRSRSTARRRSESMSGPLPRGGGRRSSIPIMFSNSKGKPPPVERTLECTLEELLSGFVKKVLITRDVVFGDG